MDERRIQKTGELLVEYANVETKVMPIIQKCLDNIKDNGKSVNPPQVLRKEHIDDSHNFQLPFSTICPKSKNKTTCKTFDLKVRLICVVNECEGEERFCLNGFSQTHFDTQAEERNCMQPVIHQSPSKPLWRMQMTGSIA